MTTEVWTLTHPARDVARRDDHGEFIAQAIAAKIPGFVDFYWLTEKEAINKAREFRIKQLDKLQAEVNALDERYDALDEADMKASGLIDIDESVRERR